ncbi:UDP-N-acetylmuramoyl-L-alanine--D-glutamate ligase [Candidatus Pelagibacter sp.]|uniref:UDP-N-acetylmuramoyl-L-alanine--D-glutamate ligase n=1 Tax=Candidatus Pelagibacter sp. TaxID=2024849 RepID=UPI003F82E733
MIINKSFFFKKKILIYGLGKSGISALKFLKRKKNKLYIFDDKKIPKKKFIKINELNNQEFDYIVISPGIDIRKCKLNFFIKKNISKVITDLDIFYAFYKNPTITITGTNGKSTSAKVLFEILKDQKKDARLVGNIGNPILSEKKIKKSSIFVIEASSYQLEYSKFFKTKHGVILNITPDHIERHGTFKNYIKAKFNLIKNQSKGTFSFLNFDDKNIRRQMISNKYKSEIIKIKTKTINDISLKIKNEYFKSDGNYENLLMIIEIIKKLKLNLKKSITTLNEFKGLKYRQQIIFSNKNLKIINDSKSTSYASSESLLKNFKKVYWIIGGIPKKNDRFSLSKKYIKETRAYIYGNYSKVFQKELNKKLKTKTFFNLKVLLNTLFSDLKKFKDDKHIILFSPAAASFDEFKNFEERGEYFNKLIKNKVNGKFNFK